MSENEKITIEISAEDFATLCVCAIRYCHGRQTYMPSLVRGIISQHLDMFSKNKLKTMIEDCDFQERFDLYGDKKIDKPGWIKWKQTLEEEYKKRK